MTGMEPRVRAAAPVWLARLDTSQAPIQTLAQGFEALRDDPATRRSHWFGQRFENIYIDRTRLPSLAPIAAEVLDCARAVLGRQDLKYGFWFNEMRPGDRTTRHAHHEDDELLSAVLYLNAPPESGDLLLYAEPAVIRVTPEAGLLVLFPPDLPHEVEPNRSAAVRLSVAFNFGPNDSP